MNLCLRQVCHTVCLFEAFCLLRPNAPQGQSLKAHSKDSYLFWHAKLSVLAKFCLLHASCSEIWEVRVFLLRWTVHHIQSTLGAICGVLGDSLKLCISTVLYVIISAEGVWFKWGFYGTQSFTSFQTSVLLMQYRVYSCKCSSTFTCNLKCFWIKMPLFLGRSLHLWSKTFQSGKGDLLLPLWIKMERILFEW